MVFTKLRRASNPDAPQVLRAPSEGRGPVSGTHGPPPWSSPFPRRSFSAVLIPPEQRGLKIKAISSDFIDSGTQESLEHRRRLQEIRVVRGRGNNE